MKLLIEEWLENHKKKLVKTRKVVRNRYIGLKCKDHLGNEFKSKQSMCDFYEQPYETFLWRMKHGYTVEEALTIKKRRYRLNKNGV